MVVPDTRLEGTAVLAVVDAVTVGIDDLIVLIHLWATRRTKVLWTGFIGTGTLGGIATRSFQKVFFCKKWVLPSYGLESLQTCAAPFAEFLQHDADAFSAPKKCIHYYLRTTSLGGTKCCLEGAEVEFG